MKTTWLRTDKGCLFTACYSKRVTHHDLPLAEIQSQAREMEKLHREKKGKLQVCSHQRWLVWGSWKGLTRSRASLVITVGTHYWLTLIDPELEAGMKKGS